MGKRQNNRIKKDFFEGEKQRREQQQSIARKVEQSEKEIQPDTTTSNLDYANFFISKNSKKMVLYDKWPDLETIINYYSNTTWNNTHPLEEYGKFEIKELLEIIKLLFSIKKQDEYKIVTTGFLSKHSYTLLEGTFSELLPNLYFLIGNDKTLEEYFQVQNLFLEEVQAYDFEHQYHPSFTALSPKKGTIRDTLMVSCQCPNSKFKYCGGIQYYDSLKEEYTATKYLAMTNIFDDSFYRKLHNYQGIQDTLSFPIHKEDEFIAQVLLSIVIYKKNHQKINLTNEDYRSIFYELFKEPVNIEKEIKKDIPKTLKYVPKN